MPPGQLLHRHTHTYRHLCTLCNWAWLYDKANCFSAIRWSRRCPRCSALVTDSAGVKSLKSHWLTCKQIKMERQTKGASRLARIYLGASVCKHLLTNVCTRAGPCADSMYAYLSTTALYAKMGNSFPLLPRRLYSAR